MDGWMNGWMHGLMDGWMDGSKKLTTLVIPSTPEVISTLDILGEYITLALLKLSL